MEQNNTGSPTEAPVKVGKYLKYAIGEIVLVVLGILIALQINNWNEDRKEGLIEQNYLKRLLVDLEDDYQTLTFSKGLSKVRINQINLLTDVIKSPELSNENPKQIIESIEKVTWRSYLPLSRIVYNELLNSGKMSLIQSEQLRALLSKYYGSAEHWEMILNLEDAQKMFSHATAGLLSNDMFSAIENSESTDQTISTQDLAIDLEKNEVDRIVQELSFNTEAIKWLPKIYHYHVLSDKVITDLSTQNETLKKLVLSELNRNNKN
jgi:hypothetical protein